MRADVRRDALRGRVSSLTPAQRAQLREHRQALQAERQRIRDAVRAGTMTRDQAREQLRTWRAQHRPNVRPPGGGVGGE
jgi:DNA-binding PadR family transcriptional regulator